MSAPTLRPYQTATLDAIAQSVAAGRRRLLIKKPTGTGKTVTFAELLKTPALAEWLSQFPPGERKMLVIAHRQELLEQAREKIERANRGAVVMIEQAGSHASRYSDVVVASIQTLQAGNFKRLKRLMTWHRFRVVVIDEAHHAAAPTYRTALALLGFLPPAAAADEHDIEAATEADVEKMEAALRTWDQVSPKDRLLVGVTATPNRSDAIGLGCVFQELTYNYALKQAIDDGWLVPIVPWVVETEVSLDAVRLQRGDFNQKQLGEAVNVDARNRLAVEAWHQYGAGMPTIAFTVNVEHAHALAGEFRGAGIRAMALSGETPKEERREILRAFGEGQLEVLTNCMVLTEGTDLPMAACILHAKPTKSATLYEQMTGRGLRPLPGDPVGPDRATAPMAAFRKPHCIVIDLVDIARKHSLATAPMLYGLPPGLAVNGMDLREADERLEKLKAEYPNINIDGALAQQRYSLEQLEVRASTFDIWKMEDLGDLTAGLRMRWIKVGVDRYALQYPWADGYETLCVEADLLGKYSISTTLRPGNRIERHSVRQHTIGHDLPTARAALTMAEVWMFTNRHSMTKLKDSGAAWRQKPMSPGQLAYLRKLGAPIKAGLTAGEASDLIELGKQRRGR
jgi:superfamily II DNA or RNA helicase